MRRLYVAIMSSFLGLAFLLTPALADGPFGKPDSVTANPTRPGVTVTFTGSSDIFGTATAIVTAGPLGGVAYFTGPTLTQPLGYPHAAFDATGPGDALDPGVSLFAFTDDGDGVFEPFVGELPLHFSTNPPAGPHLEP